MRVTPRAVARSVDRGAGGPGIEPRKLRCPGCRRCLWSGRQHGGVRYRQCPAGPAWSETLARRRNLLLGNREISCLAVLRRTVRTGKAGGPKPVKHGDEKSDPAVVAMKPANEGGQPPEELAERRGGAKGNVIEPGTRRTPSRESVSTGWIAYGKQRGSGSRNGSPPCCITWMSICCGQPMAGCGERRRRVWMGGRGGNTAKGWSANWPTCTRVFTAVPTGHCRHGGCIYRSRMDGSGHWASRRWRTRSSSAHWWKC